MNAPGTFMHEQYRHDITIQHYDLNELESFLTYNCDGNKVTTEAQKRARSDLIKRSREYASVFVDGNVDKFVREVLPLDAKTCQTIDDCLAGKRPDLSEKIWNMISHVIQDTPHKQIKIGQLDIDLINEMRVDLGTALLLAIISDENDFGTGGIDLVNHDGTRSARFGNLNTQEQTAMHIYVYQFSKNVEWTATSISMSHMPETMKLAVEGKPMKSFISHPVFDKLNITMKRVTMMMGYPIIATDYKHKLTRVSALAKRQLKMIQGR